VAAPAGSAPDAAELTLPELKKAFLAAVAECRPLLSESAADGADAGVGGALSDAEKLRLYGLFKQSTAGDCPAGAGAVAGGSADEAKLGAWRACAGMQRRVAMRAFVASLGQVRRAK